MKNHRIEYLVIFNYYIDGHSDTTQFLYCSEYDDIDLSYFILRKIESLKLLDIEVYSYKVEKHDVSILKQVILQHNDVGGTQLEI